MQKKKILTLFLTALLIAAYIGFHYYNNQDDNTAPTISFDKDKINVKTDASDEKLLEGVTAADAEDGDLTEDIIIDSISPFNSEEERTINYVVFDHENKVATASRILTYKNYKAPKFTLSDSLIQANLTTTKISSIVGATSSVDGNIDSNVEVKTGTYDDHKLPLELTVSDSTGTTSTLKLVYEYDNTNYTAEIVLKDYLIYVKKQKKGKKVPISLHENIESVMVGNSEVENLLENVVINRGKIDYSKEGVYEIIYSLDDETNYSAKCKAVIVVQ